MRSIYKALALALILAFMPATQSQAREFTGENNLGVETDLMKRVQEGLEMIYARDYQGALGHFREIKEIYPDSAVGPLGRSVVFQSMMLENFDYEYRDNYRTEADLGLALIKKAMKSPQQKAWNYFLYAALIGLDGLDRVREGDYLTAFNKGWDAVEYMKKAKQAEPDFADPDLGLGIYNYWRTAITDRVDFLPRFGDHRAEGIEQMENARDNGVLVWAGGSFALAYTYMEERKYDKAIAECLKLQEEYPNSVINNMLLARIYAKSKDYDEAFATLDKVQAVAPENRRVLWHYGDIYYKSRRDNDKAKEYFVEYLSQDNVPDSYLCHTHYRLGQISQRQRDLDTAIKHYTKALEYDPKYSPAKKRLDKVILKKAGGTTPAKSKSKSSE